MAKHDDSSEPRALDTEQALDADRRLPLASGRSVAVTEVGNEQIVEIRAPGGEVELRVRLTEDGPVMSLEGVKLEVRATNAVEVSCQTFRVDASESVEVASSGKLSLSSADETTVEADQDVRVSGKNIWLN